MTAPDAPRQVELRDEVARAIAKALTGGYPSKPKLIDYAAADAAIALIVERCAGVAEGSYASNLPEGWTAARIATAIRALAPQPEARS